jgi:Flp pilus assembly protein TadB
VEWVLLAALGIMWVAFLMPVGRKRSEASSVEDFETRMEQLAYAEVHGTTGRWIVTPRKGARFVGTNQRQRARARARRRQVFVFMLESIGITFLIGIVPPLRIVWYLAGFLGLLLVLYVWLLVSMKARAASAIDDERTAVTAAPARPPSVGPARYVGAGPTGHARATFNGLGSVGEGDTVHVVVRAAEA